ncbi:MAG: FAD synthase [Candidatus Aenigmarchaeota archaeon]|nr:FAD synthase [Candidatus Aenigmarchaeota archaeon]
MKRVLTFGTFDEFHPGHEFYLREAKKYGNELIVVVARNSTVKEIKGKYPLNDELTRLAIIQNLDYVDEATLGHEGDKYAIIEELKPNVICLGYDQHHFTDNLKTILNQRGLNPEIVRLEAFEPDIYKSSILRKQNNHILSDDE